MKILTKAATFLRRVFSIDDPKLYEQLHDERTGVAVSQQRVLGLSASFACVRLIAGTISTLPVKVTRKNPDGGVAIEHNSHWIKRLLDESPNQDTDSCEFWEFMSASLELRGHAYAVKTPSANGTRTVALRPVLADHVVEEKRAGIAGYSYVDRDNKRQWVEKERMFHIKGFLGLSTLSVARHVLGIAIATDTTAGSTFRNGARTWGALKFPKWLTKEQRDEAHEALRKDHVGAANAGRPLILEGGVDWMQLNFSPADAQLLESRSFSIEEQCRFFGVPPVLIHHNEKTTSFGTGVSAILTAFEKFSLRQRTKRIEKAIEKQLLTPVDRGNGIKVKFDLRGLLRGDEKTRTEIYKTQLASGIITINEARALEDRPPVEGGDEPRLQQQYIAITDIDALQASTAPTEDGDPDND